MGRPYAGGSGALLTGICAAALCIGCGGRISIHKAARNINARPFLGANGCTCARRHESTNLTWDGALYGVINYHHMYHMHHPSFYAQHARIELIRAYTINRVLNCTIFPPEIGEWVIKQKFELTNRLSIHAGSLAGERGSTWDLITCGSFNGVRGSFKGVRGSLKGVLGSL
jgi:hypothetical protein